MSGITTLIFVAVVMFCILGGVTLLAHIYNLNSIKSKTVGDGQHGTARWATKSEIRKIYNHIPFTPEKWREQAAKGETPTVSRIVKRRFFKKKNDEPEEVLPQGIVVGCTGGKHHTTAMVDTGDVHALMIGAAGVGKTAFWLYPCIEYACASGMSVLSTDTKGDVMRNYGNIAKGYGYNVSVIDLRNPTRSNGNNLLRLVNKYMDLYQQENKLIYKAKAEKYAKIISKTIILSGMDAASFGQNAYFYDAAEGLLTATNEVASTGTACMIMSTTENKENSWKFLEWWTSAEAQRNYGQDMELLLGASARYCTANKVAFAKIAWDKDEYNVLLKQWDSVKGIPQVAGGYFTPRHLNNAFRRVINQKQDPKETLLMYVKNINDEIAYKRNELGIK